MGTYIKIFAERQTETGGYELVELEMPYLTGQSYAYFGWLGDVRNYSAITSIAPRRGLPNNLSAELRGEVQNRWEYFATSWVSIGELCAIDYDKVIEDLRTKSGPDGALSVPCGEGVKMTLREFLGPKLVEEIFRLRDEGVDRLVFWFD